MSDAHEMQTPFAAPYGARGCVVVAWRHLGPYHPSRVQAAAARLPLVVLAISQHKIDEAYELVDIAEGAQHHTLFHDRDPDGVPASQIWRAIDQTLSQVQPRVVVSHGWAVRSALTLNMWALARGVPLVVMSESTAGDAPRSWLMEKVKARIISTFSAALVGGTASARYMERLGMAPERVFVGYDAIDNAHFERGATAACRNRDATRRLIAVPSRFFLASARFVEKKNLFRLIEAYARYRNAAGPEAWDLVVLGDGELRPRLEVHRCALGLAEHVHMPGFKQYDELPAWYGLASTFVHPSTVEPWGLVVNEAMASGLPVLVSDRCGCAPDLVKNGVNGFTFDPYDVQDLARLMHRMAHGDVDRQAMGRASQEIIKDWGPERFADGLVEATEMALSAPTPRTSWFDKLLLRALMFR